VTRKQIIYGMAFIFNTGNPYTVGWQATAVIKLFSYRA